MKLTVFVGYKSQLRDQLLGQFGVHHRFQLNVQLDDLIYGRLDGSFRDRLRRRFYDPLYSQLYTEITYGRP